MNLDVIPILFLAIIIIAEIIYTIQVNNLIKKHNREIQALIEDISELNAIVMKLSNYKKQVENDSVEIEKNNNKK